MGIYLKNNKDMVNYIVLMEWVKDNRTVMKWGRGKTLDDIYDGMSFYDSNPDFKYEIYKVSEKVFSNVKFNKDE